MGGNDDHSALVQFSPVKSWMGWYATPPMFVGWRPVGRRPQPMKGV